MVNIGNICKPSSNYSQYKLSGAIIARSDSPITAVDHNFLSCSMPEPVSSTWKILKNKALNSDIDASWKTWAFEMIEAGFESDSLYALAASTDYNQLNYRRLLRPYWKI